MTSQEADRFMLEHPQIAVKPIGGETGTWVAWNTTLKHRVGRLWVEATERGIGFSRESAIFNYRDIYHPVKSKDDLTNHCPARCDQSAKYRKIIEEYRRYVGLVSPNYESVRKGNFDFTAQLWTIIKDDYPTHCNKCGQKVKS